LTSAAGETVTLYAVWQENVKTFTIQYNANGGTGTMEDTLVTYGTSTALRANTFTRTGYDFAGWYRYRTSDNKWHYSNGTTSAWYVEGTQPDGYTKLVLSDKSKVSMTSSVDKDVCIFYAAWEANNYTVEFNANGGTGTMANLAMTYGTAKALTKNAFTRSGYTFLGWAKTADAATAAYTDAQNINNLTSAAGETVTLYAVWQANEKTFTIHFDANGGTGTMADQTIVYGVSTATTKNTFTRSGYTFKGWYAERTSSGYWAYKSASGSSTFYAKDKQPDGLELYIYSSGQKVAKTSSVDGDIVIFYAVWEANNYTVEFNANGGTGTMANLAMTYGTAKALTKNAFTRSGYTFLGWAKTADAATAAYTDAKSVKNLTSTAGGTVTLYAVWQAEMKKVSYSGSSSYKSGPFYTALSNVVLTGNPRIDIVNIAKSQIGYQESASSSQLSGTVRGSGNCTEYGRWYGLQDMWCAMFVSWCSNVAGVKTSVVPKTCSTVTALNQFIDWGRAYSRAQVASGKYTPKAGDIIFFKSSRNTAITNHIGIVTGFSGTTVYTIEGNTSSATISTNGGAVCAKEYDISNTYIVYICCPNYSTSSATPITASFPTLKSGSSGYRVKALQFILNYYGASLTANGDFGSGTVAAVKNFQTANGLNVTGIVDNATWAKLCAVTQSKTSYNQNLAKAIQTLLNGKDGTSLEVDGAFGSGTKAAVVLFQASVGLTANGTVNSNTWKYLFS
ncbi:MAG: InlB B-repeat-containing protein, partial [Clostridia bacterium]|nr:InlB B-repeat-containing protein [Clostridia bacterium]